MTINDFLQFHFCHGEAFLFVWILAEQAGLPIPTVPLLLAAGSLASVGEINFAWSAGLAWAACLLADSLWYLIGRCHGSKVLWLLRRISLVPDAYAHRIKVATRRHGACTLLVAKFVPGLNFAAPFLAGISGVTPLRFLIFDTMASVLWASAYMSLGYFFTVQFERLATYVLEPGTIVVVASIAATAAFIGFKIIRSYGWPFLRRADESSPAGHWQGKAHEKRRNPRVNDDADQHLSRGPEVRAY